MEAFIAGLIAAALSPVRKVVDAVEQRLSAIYNHFTDALGRARNGFVYWVGKGRAWASATVRHALAVATVLRWLVLVAIPRWLDQRVDDVTGWARSRLAELRQLAQAWVTQAIEWARARIAEGVAELARLRDWAIGQIASLAADARRLVDRVFGVLGTPERVVAWILGALVTALVEYALDNAVRVAALAYRNRDAVMARSIDLAEDLIDRVM